MYILNHSEFDIDEIDELMVNKNYFIPTFLMWLQFYFVCEQNIIGLCSPKSTAICPSDMSIRLIICLHDGIEFGPVCPTLLSRICGTIMYFLNCTNYFVHNT